MINQILRESELKIQSFQEQMKRFEKDPMILVNEVFTDNDLLLPILIQRYGNDVLLDVQEYWYRFFLPKFKQYLGVEEISLFYDPTIYPAPIQIYLGEEVIAYLDIVGHQYQRAEIMEVLQAQERIFQIKEELKTLEEELHKKEPAMQNILYLGGANPIKLLDISIRQKKYKKDVTEEVRSLNDQYLELDRERIHLESLIKQMRRNHVEREYLLNRIEKRIQLLPGYSHFAGEVDDELEEIEGLERGFTL